MEEKNSKILPIGISSLKVLREDDKYLYVDKTKNVYNLVNRGKYYFLSRPRRFGKSLLCDTIKQLFLGKKELFKGLWIEGKWDFDTRKYPVIHITMRETKSLKYKHQLNNIMVALIDSAEVLGVDLDKESYHSIEFRKLIKGVIKKTGKKPVILIDEYDKPLHPFLGGKKKLEGYSEDELASQVIRSELAELYGVLKDMADSIEFLFMTGVSKFSKTSVFSKLNNLKDLTYDGSYIDICGYTHKEVLDNFKGHIKALAKERDITYDMAWDKLKEWYNGYRFCEDKEQVFNPFSLMLSLQEKNFKNYWLSTGNPSFLVQLLKKKTLTLKQFENPELGANDIDSLDLNDINVYSLMLQTGYLTIKGRRGDIYYLEYPNGEISKSLLSLIASIYSEISYSTLYTTSEKLKFTLIDNDMESLFEEFSILLSSVPYQIVQGKEQESHFHLAFHIVFKLLGFKILSEISMFKGRIDSVLETDSHIYLFEFKVNKAVSNAIKQIKEKEYFLPYLSEKAKKVILLGVSFNTENKEIKYKQIEVN